MEINELRIEALELTNKAMLEGLKQAMEIIKAFSRRLSAIESELDKREDYELEQTEKD